MECWMFYNVFKRYWFKLEIMIGFKWSYGVGKPEPQMYLSQYFFFYNPPKVYNISIYFEYMVIMRKTSE